MMKSTLLIFSSLVGFAGLSSATNHWSFDLDARLWDQVPFISNDAPTPFGSYLVRNVPFEPIRSLKGALESSLHRQLLGRNEAHITVITPPEYEQLKDKVRISEIQEIVRDSIQNTKFDVICLAKGSAQLSGKQESTYFVVVVSQGLFNIRRQIAQLFSARGGSQEAFDPESFYPHITVAYTKRDLHAQDGVIKNKDACFADVRVPGAL